MPAVNGPPILVIPAKAGPGEANRTARQPYKEKLYRFRVRGNDDIVRDEIPQTLTFHGNAPYSES
jgi:hypothetical protein